MNSVMPSGHTFSQVPKAEIQRSSFDRSHGHKTTFNAGYLIPVFVDEALPGDTFNLNMTAFARLSTPKKPIMDNLFLDSFFFSVPVRLLWSNWQRFMGEKLTITDTTAFTVPYIVGPSGDGIVTHSLSDYMGLPVGIASIQFNALHHRAYNLIWNQWFRDQNLQNPVVVGTSLDPLGDGPDTYTDYVLLRRGKRHDYFTSCLPWPQKGTAVSIPLGTSATVKLAAADGPQQIRAATGHGLFGADTLAIFSDGQMLATTAAAKAVLDPAGTLYADLGTAAAATINSLRQAFQLQKLYERDARGGSRYIEIVKAHFGVESPDLRATRPEYLGGGSSPVNINPVPQTSVTDTTPQGNLAAYGTVTAAGHGFTKSFTEHCVILGLVSVRADLTYQQGMDRMFSRRTKYDFYWPALAHIGEQSVLNKEIYCDGSGNDDLVFGYQERFAEYRYKPSKITGIFRSNCSSGVTPIDIWHVSQDFGSLPTLNSTFIQETPPVDRIVAVNTEPQFYFDSYFKLICARPMPVYGVPGLIDHF